MSENDQQARQRASETAEHPVPQAGLEKGAAALSGEPEQQAWPQISSSMLQNMILSAIHDLLGPVVGDGVKLLLIVDTGENVHLLSDHPDAWGVLDHITCADDDENEPLTKGLGSVGRLLN